MNSNDTRKIPKFDYLMLLPIMALAFYITFIPHLNYPYPVHIDEWIHLALSKAMLTTGSTTFVDPFLGQTTLDFSSDLQGGFQLFWGVFQQISGLSWLTIFRYFPGIMFMITVLSVYILARRQGFGWEAAFFDLPDTNHRGHTRPRLSGTSGYGAGLCSSFHLYCL